MPIDSRIEQCQHIKFNGIRCGSPAMRGALKCYFHLRPAKFDDIRVPEVMDFPTKQKLIAEIVNGVIAHQIDAKRAIALTRLIKLSDQYEFEERALRRRAATMTPTAGANLVPAFRTGG